ncbi:erythroid membrane-associated protein-like [Engraulis encrasicolus]|uniref:erythroid membrane-associated protein-like n=1 Tax=Engraulis encrasicolus TaxID=184585 RepID=UPI002FD6DEDA
MEMTEGVYRKVDPDGDSSSLSAVKSVEADEVLNKTSTSTENAADPNRPHSAGREQQGMMEMTERVYQKVDPDGGSSSLSAVKSVEADEVLNKTSNSTENAADPNRPHSVLSVQMIMMSKQLEQSYREKLQMQADYDNMTSDYQQLQMSYNDLNTLLLECEPVAVSSGRVVSLLCCVALWGREQQGRMEMTEGVYRKVDPDGEVKSVETDEVFNETSNITENAGDPNHQHSAGREQQGGMEMTERVYRKVDPDGGSSSLSAVKSVEADEVLNKTSNSTENAADPNHPHSVLSVQMIMMLEHSYREKLQMQADYDNMTSDYQQLQMSNNDLNSSLSLSLSLSVDVTLDPDTAANSLILSADGKQVKTGDTSQNRPDNPKRFDHVVSVLGKHGFNSGRFYYEVQVSGKTAWSLGVARESINRKGSVNLSPTNGFWTIWLRDSEYRALAGPSVTLSLKEKPERVGVFVDYGAGLVSFYDADRWSLIYSYEGVSFREKIYPYFCPNKNNNGKNSAPLVITSVSCFK